MNGIVELAKLLKERENPLKMGLQVGTVLETFPDIKVSVGDNIILSSKNLYFAEHLLDKYKRCYKIDEGNIKFSNTDCGHTNSVQVGENGYHNHIIESINISTTANQEGTIQFTDTLEIGDSVLLIPFENEQQFYVADRVVQV